jgi:hypothetical protein
MADCAACSTVPWERTTAALFRVREPKPVAATCGRWGACLVSWADDGPAVTVVVRCDPVVRGPDVAQQSRAWKARPGTPLGRDPTLVAQVRSVCDRPLLTMRETARCRCYGHAEARTKFLPACR